MDKLPSDLIYLILAKVPIKAVFNFMHSCRKYYKLKNQVLNLLSNKTLKHLTRVKLVDIDQTATVNDNIYKFKNLVIACVEDDMWYLTWKDLDDNIANHIKLWLIYLTTITKVEYTIENYILPTMLKTLWKLRSGIGLLFGVNQPFSPFLHNFILKAKFSFRLTMVILTRLTKANYAKLVELYSLYYYNKKIKTITPCNGSKVYNLLVKIKPYLPNLYYKKLNSLSLSTKQWTTIFICEAKAKYADYNQVVRRFSGKPILTKVIIKKLGIGFYQKYMLLTSNKNV